MSLEHLYKAVNWTNRNIPFVVNRPIIEYDMRRAGLSVIKEFELLPQDKIQKLDEMEKHKSDVTIGKMRKKDKDFSKRFGEAMTKARKLFIDANRLEEPDIISIKNDAFFVIGECMEREFGFIEFRPKNTYTSFINLDRIEFYYSSQKMDVKGLGDDVLRNQEDYWIASIQKFMRLIETGTKAEVLLYMKHLVDSYKALELPGAYYREFSVQDKYRTLEGDLYGEYWEDRKEDLDISYNYEHVVLPLVLLGMKYE